MLWLPQLHPSGGPKSKVTWLFAAQSVTGVGACTLQPNPVPNFLFVTAFTAAPTWKELWQKYECSTSNAPSHILGFWPDYYCNSMDTVTEHWDKYINMSGIHVQNTKSYTGKISPITGPRCPEGSRKLRFQHYVATTQNGGKVVSLTHRPFLPPGNTPGTHFC